MNLLKDVVKNYKRYDAIYHTSNYLSIYYYIAHTKSKFLVVINLRCRICSRTLQNAYTISDNGNSLTLHYIIIHVGVTSYIHIVRPEGVSLSLNNPMRLDTQE